jgi:DNA primase large subunit
MDESEKDRASKKSMIKFLKSIGWTEKEIREQSRLSASDQKRKIKNKIAKYYGREKE